MGFSERNYARSVRGGQPPLPPVTKALLIINGGIFLLDLMLRPTQGYSGVELPGPFEQWGAFQVSTGLLGGRIWELVTFQFLHAGVMHVFLNMMAVYFFGPWVERWWGSRRFIAYYLLCGVAGALFFSLLLGVRLLPNADMHTPLIGASAGVFGLLFAIYRIAPETRVSLLFPPVTLTMRKLALIVAGLAVLTILGGLLFPNSLWFANSGGEAGHLGGALMGLLLMRYPRLLRKGGSWTTGRKILRPKQFRRRRHEEKIRPRTTVDLHSESEVDRILEKVTREGLGSLTAEERKILEQASQRS
ncbi:membrane associated rhomboid family serine protease [Haloferula luteola]|uniref:Membrane associated rhomboid family serine protease n=1 Tax=Haloferula luteola TaxID=595692 RepID=A0A840VCX1_9BACT|nr:rhomboid family intramembrane serine protease [Haloferula luteola]MBB5353374.1 membrane associated rhomboid family serine protease [Haloferula luteola]